VQKIKHETPSTLSFLSFYLHRLKINNSFSTMIRVTTKVVKQFFSFLWLENLNSAGTWAISLLYAYVRVISHNS